MASVRKRGSTYQIAVSCGYDATGKSRRIMLPSYCISMLKR